VKRPTRTELLTDDMFGIGKVIVDVLDAAGIDIDELPDIIPDDPEKSPAMRQVVEDIFRAKGWPVDDEGT
jgi:hypothetical protein